MKRLFQITTPREIANSSRSFAYQIKDFPSRNCVRHKILTIHEKRLSHNYVHFSVVAYYFWGCRRNSNSFCWFENFDTYQEAENKVKDLIMKRGSGSEREWEKFFKARVSKKVKKICVG